MCRKGAWAELTVKVTFGVRIRSRMPGIRKNTAGAAVMQLLFLAPCRGNLILDMVVLLFYCIDNRYIDNL